MSSEYAVVGYGESSCPPTNGLKLGEQEDGEYWLAIAKSQWGTIPGKANGKGECWYPYGGKEYYVTKEFAYVTSIRPTKLVKNCSPPPFAIMSGYQTDGAGYVYAAVAESEYGKIPGKAKGDTCWYSYDHQEHSTKNFSWVVLEQ